LKEDEMLNFLKIIAAERCNAIYFAGALRDYIPVELSSGKDDLFLPDGTVFHNKAQILNRKEPGNILNLHGDRLQLKKMLEKLQPREVCLFHQNQQRLSPVRRWINKEYPFIKETHAIYGSKIEIPMKYH
jgi:hypothetical protein